MHARTCPTGFAALDAALPGAGWPTQGLSEILQPPGARCEWRLLAPALAPLLADADARLFLVAPPLPPHAVGLAQLGLPAERLVWLPAAAHAGSPAQAPQASLWAAEQLILATPPGAILAWLPQAGPAQIRRLQVHAQGCDAPVFVFRPEAALHEPSAAPLRVTCRLGPGWTLALRIPKRRGATCDEELRLAAIPLNWQAVLPPRLRELEDHGAGPAPQPPSGAMPPANPAQLASVSGSSAPQRAHLEVPWV
jgi:protein ImuA